VQVDVPASVPALNLGGGGAAQAVINRETPGEAASDSSSDSASAAEGKARAKGADAGARKGEHGNVASDGKAGNGADKDEDEAEEDLRRAELAHQRLTKIKRTRAKTKFGAKVRLAKPGHAKKVQADKARRTMARNKARKKRDIVTTADIQDWDQTRQKDEEWADKAATIGKEIKERLAGDMDFMEKATQKEMAGDMTLACFEKLFGHTVSERAVLVIWWLYWVTTLAGLALNMWTTGKSTDPDCDWSFGVFGFTDTCGVHNGALEYSACADVEDSCGALMDGGLIAFALVVVANVVSLYFAIMVTLKKFKPDICDVKCFGLVVNSTVRWHLSCLGCFLCSVLCVVSFIIWRGDAHQSTVSLFFNGPATNIGPSAALIVFSGIVLMLFGMTYSRTAKGSLLMRSHRNAVTITFNEDDVMSDQDLYSSDLDLLHSSSDDDDIEAASAAPERY
jgi:hypothetical protein